MDKDPARGCVCLLDFDHGRDSFLQVFYVGYDTDMAAACGVEFLQCRHYAVEPFLTQVSESLVYEDCVYVYAVFRKARQSQS